MNRALLKKSLEESRLLLAACTIALFGFCWIRVWIVGLLEMSRFEKVVEQFREYEHFSPVPLDQLFTYAGRISLAFGEPVVLLCVGVWAVARGSDAISGEVGRGTMELLLAQPVRRWGVLGAQALVTVGGVAVLAVAAWLGVYCGIRTTTVKEPAPGQVLATPWPGWEIPNPFVEPRLVEIPLEDKVDPEPFAAAAANLFSLGVFLAGFSTLMSSWDRHRWRTIGLVVGFVIVQMVFKLVALASPSFQWLRRCTFWSAYEPERFVSLAIRKPEQAWNLVITTADQAWSFGPLGSNLLLIGLGLAAYAAAGVIFQRRDLPAPL